MAEQMAGFPYWQVAYNEQGQSADASAEAALLAELPGQALTDLFVISHGWNNDQNMARALYAAYLGQMQALLGNGAIAKRRTPKAGAVGVIWPSMRWADEQPPLPASGGVASVQPPPSTSATVLALKAVYPDPAQQQALDQLASLLQQRPADPTQFVRFQQLLRPLVSSPSGGATEDSGEQALLSADPRRLLPMFAAVARRPAGGGGAADLGSAFNNLWGGAVEVLRAATYFEMKERAGLVGTQGLGPLIGRIAQAQPDLRIHLLGHSFGARVVAFTLAGMPSDGASPVKSLFLLQGAFSHFAFAPTLPQDPSRSGALAGKQARVDGPLLVSHSVHDTAVGQLYPLASLASQDDSAAFGDALYRWGAMGCDGAQAVSAADCQLGSVGQNYPFQPGAFVNLNGDAVITAGAPPSGAHGDIFHPQLAWATLAAAGIC